jgi:hypothetical protein
VYDGFEKLNGAVVSTKWTFYNWSKEKGIHGERIGRVTASNIKAVNPPATLFEKPDNARRIEPPQ